MHDQRRFIGKARMHIMGLASNLYLLNENPNEIPNRYCEQYIPSEFISSAIYMMQKFVESTYRYCIQNGIINDTNQIKVVYDLFAKQGMLSMHEIKTKCEKVKPFKDLPSAREIIEGIVHYLANNNILLLLDGSSDEYIKNTRSYVFI